MNNGRIRIGWNISVHHLVGLVVIASVISLLRLLVFPAIQDTAFELPYLLFVLVGSFACIWCGARIWKGKKKAESNKEIQPTK